MINTTLVMCTSACFECFSGLTIDDRRVGFLKILSSSATSLNQIPFRSLASNYVFCENEDKIRFNIQMLNVETR